VTAYSVLRPDGNRAVMMVNRDQRNAHQVQIVFKKEQTKNGTLLFRNCRCAYFGPEQYKWHPAQQIVDPSHFPFEPKNPLQQYKPGYAEPDGPIKESMLQGDKSTAYEVPASSIVVLRGKLNSDGK
jgi:hypothetical protein